MNGLSCVADQRELPGSGGGQDVSDLRYSKPCPDSRLSSCRKLRPSSGLCRLESWSLLGLCGAADKPCCDAACGADLHSAPIEVYQQFLWQTSTPQVPQKEETLLGLPKDSGCLRPTCVDDPQTFKCSYCAVQNNLYSSTILISSGMRNCFYSNSLLYMVLV